MIISKISPFSTYLAQRAKKFNYQASVLNTIDMLDQVAHCEDTSFQKKTWIPVGGGQVICHSQLSGIIILTDNLLAGTRQGNNHLEHYVECAWIAFWLYACKQMKTVINALHHKMLCPSYLSVPHVFQAMREVGLKTPQWRFDSNHNQTRVARQRNADRLSDQERGSDDIHKYDGCLDIQLPKGQRVFCLYVMGQIIQDQASKSTSIPREIQIKVMTLCRDLCFDLAEVVLIRYKNDWFGYHVSRQPGWDARWQSQWGLIAHLLLSGLNSQDNEHRPARKATETFIMPSDLPFARQSQPSQPTNR